MAELAILKEEERMLMRLASKLNDQLNRLKVEELTLLSRIRSEKSCTSGVDHNATLLSHNRNETFATVVTEDEMNAKPLNLEVKTSDFQFEKEDEEEEEEMDADDVDDDDVKNDQLTTFLEKMTAQRQFHL